MANKPVQGLDISGSFQMERSSEVAYLVEESWPEEILL